ncbi:glycosyltransferase family 1 protein [Corynebacterium falsenii]|uniref:glycosyltransferase family 4 protein n=1 Tax=Corynebacterium falsenii TaxID=108486 RepID=UPI001CCC973E|nr:glycosyltransferase family 1 protein [Corynebacterium falsenii]UBI07310.1 glycosyltransferase family 1 protein [Corynebacterium falsenii]
MRVAIVAESFLPNVNGVTNSILRVLEHLRRTGHEALVIAPGARDDQEEIFSYQGYRIARVPTVEVPGINSLPIGVPMPSIVTELRAFQPDVVHLASPFVLGGAGALAAKSLRLPCVAVYQTDVAGFANNYKMRALSRAAWQWTRALHNRCAVTLAPSSPAMDELKAHGVKGVNHWGRGVDTVRFHPSKRSADLRAEWFAAGDIKRGKARPSAARIQDLSTTRKVVGFVGRLAAEKSVEKLAALDGRDDIQLVIVGDGPEMGQLKELMPTAVFTGGLYGDDLPQAYASLDVFVHAGQFETFCQAIQEAQASGVPTIGPAAGGPIDLIAPGFNGYLLEPDEFAAALSGTVESIIHGDLDAFRRNAFEGVQHKSWADLCDQLLGYYKQAIIAKQNRTYVPEAVGNVADSLRTRPALAHSQRANSTPVDAACATDPGLAEELARGGVGNKKAQREAAALR